MAGKKEEGNILSSMITGIILQIKPYSPGSNGKESGDLGAAKITNAEINELAREMGNGTKGKKMTEYEALVAATEKVHRDKVQAILDRLETSAKKEEMLPRKGIFRWLRRNGSASGGQGKPAPAMKK